MRLVTDPSEHEAEFRRARGDAPSWPSWGPCKAWYISWVDDHQVLESLLLIDPSLVGNQATMRIELATSVRGSARVDQESEPTFALWVVHTEDDQLAYGHGPLGQPASRCRPLTEHLSRAVDELLHPV